jgi:hypothetical protein
MLAIHDVHVTASPGQGAAFAPFWVVNQVPVKLNGDIVPVSTMVVAPNVPLSNSPVPPLPWHENGSKNEITVGSIWTVACPPLNSPLAVVESDGSAMLAGQEIDPPINVVPFSLPPGNVHEAPEPVKLATPGVLIEVFPRFQAPMQPSLTVEVKVKVWPHRVMKVVSGNGKLKLGQHPNPDDGMMLTERLLVPGHLTEIGPPKSGYPAAVTVTQKVPVAPVQ